MTNKNQIIKATKEHADLITRIGKQTFLESHGHSASEEDIYGFIVKTYNKEAINKEFENTKVQYHIIYCNGEVAGFSKIELNIANKNIRDLKVTKLDRLYLLKEFHGQNLGSELLDSIIQVSKNNKQNGIWLAVWVENQRAIKFYIKSGFKIVGAYDFVISATHSNPNHIMYLEY